LSNMGMCGWRVAGGGWRHVLPLGGECRAEYPQRFFA
jgi:hypothetical protein